MTLDLRNPNSRGYRLFGWAMIVIMLISFALAIVAARAIAMGAPDTYHNQHLRLLANSLTGLFLAAGQLLLWRARFISFPKLGWILWVAVYCTLAWSVWLMRP